MSASSNCDEPVVFKSCQCSSFVLRSYVSMRILGLGADEEACIAARSWVCLCILYATRIPYVVGRRQRSSIMNMWCAKQIFSHTKAQKHVTADFPTRTY